MIDKQKLSVKLGQRLAELRSRKGFTQERLAYDAGLNRAYVGYIERGERNPSVETMFKLATALKIELSELFKI